MKQKVLERDAQKAILDYLGYKKILAWRNNAGTAQVKMGQKEYWMQLAPKGSSDIIGCLPDGRFLAIECKGSEGKLTLEQTRFIIQVVDLGGVAFVARSIDDVEKHFEYFEVKCG